MEGVKAGEGLSVGSVGNVPEVVPSVPFLFRKAGETAGTFIAMVKIPPMVTADTGSAIPFYFPRLAYLSFFNHSRIIILCGIQYFIQNLTKRKLYCEERSDYLVWAGGCTC